MNTKVTCILPTRARPGFVVQAVRGFLEQDYLPRELVVVDDGEFPVRHLLPRDERIRYFHLPGRPCIGVKRNFACEQASGDIIAHTDDDDWYPADRLTRQVRALSETGAVISGTSTLHFFDPRSGRAWVYAYPQGGWLAGASLVYVRSHWREHPFRLLQVGEDWSFVRSARAPGTLHDLGDPWACVATVHGRNSSRKSPDAYWREVDVGGVRATLGERADAYRAAALES
jgi:glycosyltransferase involved in cell wall biosynthesis